MKIEITSPPDFDDLVVEVELDEKIGMLISKEPEDRGYYVSIYNILASELDSREFGHAKKDERRRLPVDKLIGGVERAVDALEAMPHREK